MDRSGLARSSLCLLALALAALSAGAARAADCFAPLATNDKWACTARLSTGESVSYCLNLTSESGSGATRSFGMVTTGPYPRTCTCAARGKAPSPVFNAAASYLCYDETTDTAEIGKISRRKIVGETFNASVNVRTTFTCRVDASCAVLP